MVVSKSVQKMNEIFETFKSRGLNDSTQESVIIDPEKETSLFTLSIIAEAAFGQVTFQTTIR